MSLDLRTGVMTQLCPECNGSGLDCDDDYCDESCWYCQGCGVLVDCIDDMCPDDLQDGWCV